MARTGRPKGSGVMTRAEALHSLRLRLQDKSKVNEATGCVEWVGCTNKDGYGSTTLFGRYIGTHRAAWLVAFSSIPDRMSVLHQCDNRRCMNINHLFLGTQNDNMKDCASKGRIVVKPRRGSASTSAKIVESDVVAIREGLLSGRSGYSIAYEYGISEATVSNIKHGKRWAHVL